MDYISKENEAVRVEVSEVRASNNALMSYGKQMVVSVNAEQKAPDEKKSVRDRLK